MIKFHVLVREVYISHMEIEAETPEHATELVREGAGEEVYLEYSHTADEEHWTAVRQINDAEKGAGHRD